MRDVESICRFGMQLAGRGDKPSTDDFNQALTIMQDILSDWATTRDVHLWNLINESRAISVGDAVSAADGSVYQCYIDHTSTADDEPNTADLFADYWVASNTTATPLTWAADNSYLSNRTIAFTDLNVEDVLAIQVQHSGQISGVEKISMMEFKELPVDELGLPTKCYVQKTDKGLVLNLWPLCDVEDAKLFFYEIRRPNLVAGSETITIPDQWIKALYYALAVELGFMYNIEMQRLSILGQKAALEFGKAFLTNASEVDECFVKPLYS